MGVYFALRAVEDQNQNYACFLYDAWEGMKEDYLLKTEIHQVGNYSYLKMDNTIRNLSQFKKNIFFNKGFIPDSFTTSNNPDSLNFIIN